MTENNDLVLCNLFLDSILLFLLLLLLLCLTLFLYLSKNALLSLIWFVLIDVFESCCFFFKYFWGALFWLSNSVYPRYAYNYTFTLLWEGEKSKKKSKVESRQRMSYVLCVSFFLFCLLLFAFLTFSYFMIDSGYFAFGQLFCIANWRCWLIHWKSEIECIARFDRSVRMLDCLCIDSLWLFLIPTDLRVLGAFCFFLFNFSRNWMIFQWSNSCLAGSCNRMLWSEFFTICNFPIRMHST